MVEACALVREAVKRRLGQRPYDEHVIAGIAMAGGREAEMAWVLDEIHLVTLGGKWPYEVFHEHAREAFVETLASIDDEIVATFKRIEITTDGVDWEAEG